jgi:hypothetical protein
MNTRSVLDCMLDLMPLKPETFIKAGLEGAEIVTFVSTMVSEGTDQTS